MAWVEPVAQVLESIGVLVIVVGALVSTWIFGADLLRTSDFKPVYHAYRANLGRGILLGLEFLVAGDIIATILVQPTLQSISALGLIVLIRTFLSFSLETEIEGHFPWLRARDSKA
ncbi:MAG: DUF1622 domain-containing protein [Gemmatimonadota bacterium]